MKLEMISQKPYNTSLMGVITGISSYYELPFSDEEMFGLSAHAFLVNIHDILCPSGPYVWNDEWFYELLKNTGIEATFLGFFSADNTTEERNNIEKTIREHIESNNPCYVVNMDNQIIYGYDETGLLLSQPWSDCVCTTPQKLTYATWDEFGKELHVAFFSFRKCEPKDRKLAIKESLAHAVKLLESKDDFSPPRYATGLKAYDNWISAVSNDHGASHGSWWNSVVWSECRKMAGNFLERLIKDSIGDPGIARRLSDNYRMISDIMLEVSNKEMDKEEKIRKLKEIQSMEKDSLALLKEYTKTLD
ncbi:MAG: hypothetical protein JXA60_00880 [Candidatus Coatesbacteria bacterium]|nr:hypothetical protein [Candidatus Coatesbacteria bacterium]